MSNDPEYDRVLAELHQKEFGALRSQYAVFSLGSVIDREATDATGYEPPEEQGAPPKAGYIVYKDAEMVEQRYRGSKEDGPEQSWISEPVTDALRRKYPQEYARFRAWLDNPHHPISIIPHIRQSAIETLRGLRLFSVEQLAESTMPLPDVLERHRNYARLFLQYLPYMTGARKPKFRLIEGEAA